MDSKPLHTNIANSKFHEMLKLLDEKNEKAATLIISQLPEKLIDNLVELDLPHKSIEKLLAFLIKKKVLTEKSKAKLYYQLAFAQDKHNRKDAVIYFFERSLECPGHPVEKKHTILLNLAMLHIEKKDKEKAYANFREALELEKSKLKPNYIIEYGVIAILLSNLRKHFATNFSVSMIWLNYAMDIAPSDPRVVEAAKACFAKGYELFKKSIDINILSNLFRLSLTIPILKNKIPEIVNLIKELPEKEFNAGFKAKCLIIFHQFKEAFELAKAGIEEDPEDVEALLGLAICYREFSMISEANTAFLNVVNHKDLKPEQQLITLASLATTNVSLGNYHEAISYAEEAIKLDPNYIPPYIDRILANMALSEVNRATKLLKKAKFLFPKSQAIASLQDQLFPKNISSELNKNALINTLLTEIDFHTKNKDYEPAIKKALFLVERETFKIPALIALACIYKQQGNFSKALEYYLAIEKQQPQSYNKEHMMICYFYLNKHEEAEKLAWNILNHEKTPSKRAQKDRNKALVILFLIYDAAESYKEGIQKLEQALSSDEFTEDEKQILHYHLAYFHYHIDDYAKALIHINQSLSFTTNKLPPNSYLVKGYSYYFSGQKLQAIAPLQKYLEFHPDECEPHIILGYAIYFSDPSKLSEALQHFAEALDLDPSCLQELKEVLPSSIIDTLLAEESPKLKPDLSPIDTLSLHIVEAEEKIITRPAEYKPSLTPQQISHRFFQTEKLRQSRELKAKLCEDKESKESTDELWELANHQTVTSSTSGLRQLSFKKQKRLQSHLFSYLDKDSLKESLKKEYSEELIGSWQDILDASLIVGKKGKQGIRLLNSNEAAKIAERTGKQGYVAKLKLLGHFGEVRGLGRLIPSQTNPREKLLCFDFGIVKSHRS